MDRTRAFGAWLFMRSSTYSIAGNRCAGHGRLERCPWALLARPAV